MEWKKGKPRKKGWYNVTIISKSEPATTCAYWTGKEWTQLEESENGGYIKLDVIAYASELPSPCEV